MSNEQVSCSAQSTESAQSTRSKQVAHVIDAVIEAVSVADVNVGAPGGVMYAVLSAFMSLHEFENLMINLVRAGLLRKSGQCYFLTEVGIKWYQARVA